MVLHRCPWCGEKISMLWMIIYFLKPDMDRYHYKKLFCPYCKQELNSKLSKTAIIISFFLFIGLLFWDFKTRRYHALFNSSIDLAIIILYSIIINVFYVRYPHSRKTEKGKEMPAFSIQVGIQWQPHQQKGLASPKYQVLNGEIFPAFFLSNGKLISDGWCVLLDQIHWNSPRTCTCTISLVLDDAPQQFLEPGNQFKLFHGKREIATGTIL